VPSSAPLKLSRGLPVRLVERHRWLPVPGQRSSSRLTEWLHSFEHISEIGERLDDVEGGPWRRREADNGPTIAAAVRAGELMVLTAERDRSYGALVG
jgi:hypothetical protein